LPPRSSVPAEPPERSCFFPFFAFFGFFAVEPLPLSALLPRSSDFFGACGRSAGVGVDDGVSVGVGVLVDVGDPGDLSRVELCDRLDVGDGVEEAWVGRFVAAARAGRAALVASGWPLGRVDAETARGRTAGRTPGRTPRRGEAVVGDTPSAPDGPSEVAEATLAGWPAATIAPTGATV
jgi:hypothetical protein